MPEFDHKSAFVTGGSRGVGRAVCLEAGDTQAQIRAALPHLRRASGGAIVTISSIAAQMCQARNVDGGQIIAA
jgi:NAD(P)-dependent dehydrogenase (short-subunit alcohol dehydrogenase family)